LRFAAYNAGYVFYLYSGSQAAAILELSPFRLAQALSLFVGGER
jgi:hypothetical protein